MSCMVIQRQLLSAEQPEQPAADIKSHLAQCPSCRAWHRRLVQMERQIALLPIPPSTARHSFLQRLTGTSSCATGRQAIADPATLWRSPLVPGPKERALRKVSLAFALAASLLVFALAWWSWPHEHIAAPQIDQQEQIRLAQLKDRLHEGLHAHTPKERVLRLAKLADEVHGEALKLGDNSEKLEQRAQFYSRVVGTHLMEQARQLPPADRSAVLQKIADNLRKAESAASRREAELQTVAPRSAASLRRIAVASRKGERDLRALLNG